MQNNLHNKKVPRHVAIIMDGNGRWAAARGVDKADGHSAGVGSLRKCVIAAKDAHVEYLTAYAFSTENWGRPKEEVDAIMGIFSMVVLSEARELATNSIRIRFVGDISGLDEKLIEQIAEAENLPIEKIEMTLTIAMNYSARWDIVSAAKLAAQSGEEITQENYAKWLSTSFLPDVDLVVRTSGEQRLSNFMLWESSYAELYFTDKLWPDFGSEDFNEAIEWYGDRDRRYGVRK